MSRTSLRRSWTVLGAAAGIFLGALAAAPAHASACNLQAIKLYPTGGAPKIGTDYLVTLEYKIENAPAASFKIRFRMAGQTAYLNMPGGGPGNYVAVCSFGKLPLDGTIQADAYLDPNHTSGEYETGWLPYLGNIATTSFKPVPPATGIEFYEPRTFHGTQTCHVVFNSASPGDRLAVMMGKPETDSWQKVLSDFCQMKVNGVWQPTIAAVPDNSLAARPIFMWDHNNVAAGDYLLQQSYTVEERNTRCNADKLRTVTWAQFDALSGINYLHYFQQPDAVNQSESPEISQFVVDTLGSDYRNHFTPYDAARKLFQACVARMTYVYPSPSNSAVEAYNKKKGDCGAFSLLIVASMRHIGFPARICSGIWEGTDGGHAWSELFFPWYGWMVCDGSASDYWSPNGDYAYCFGNLVDLNKRISYMRGNCFQKNGVTANWLQGPQPFWWGMNNTKWENHASLIAN